MDVRIFDVPGCFIRYTVVIDRGIGSQEFYVMSENPHQSHGINLFCGTTIDGYKEGPHLGRKMKGIPKCIYDAIKKRINTNGKVLEKAS